MARNYKLGWASVALGLCIWTGGITHAKSDENTYAPSQGWTTADAKRWYELPQGSRLIKQSWVKALKNNDDSLFFAQPGLSKYGYIFGSETDPLPLGFTTEEDQQGNNWVGLNCSACHTAELKANSVKVLVHGGQAMADFQQFLGDLIASVDNTVNNPEKFAAFSRDVSGKQDDQELKDQLSSWLKRCCHIKFTQSQIIHLVKLSTVQHNR